MQRVKTNVPNRTPLRAGAGAGAKKNIIHQARHVSLTRTTKTYAQLDAEHKEIINATKAIHSRSCAIKEIETPEQRYNSYIKNLDYYKAGIFLIELIKHEVKLHNKTVTPSFVMDTLNQIINKTSFVYLKAVAELHLTCFTKNIEFNGKPITPEFLVESFRPIKERYPSVLEQLHSKKVQLNGKEITIEQIYNAYRKANLCTEKGNFLYFCFRNGYLKEKHITPESILANYRESKKSLSRIAEIKYYCFKQKVLINNKPVAATTVYDCMTRAGNQFQMINFKIYCCRKGIEIKGRPIPPEKIIEEIKALENTNEKNNALAFFLRQCYLNNIKINKQSISEATVIDAFDTANMHCEKLKFYITTLKAKKNKEITVDSLIDLYKETDKSKIDNNTKAMFFGFLYTGGYKFNGEPINPNKIANLFKHTDADENFYAKFMAECVLNKTLINGNKVKIKTVLDLFSTSPKYELEKVNFLRNCFVKNIHDEDNLTNHEDIIVRYQRANAKEQLAIFLSYLIVNKIISPSHFYSPIKVYNLFGSEKRLNHYKVYFAYECLMNNIRLIVDKDTQLQDFVASQLKESNLIVELNKVKRFCFLRGIPLHRRHQQLNVIVEQCRQTSKITKTAKESAARQLYLTRFLMTCCLKGFRLNNVALDPNALIAEAEKIEGGGSFVGKFKMECLQAGFFHTPVKEILAYFDEDLTSKKIKASVMEKLFFSKYRDQIKAIDLADTYKSNNQMIEFACFMARCCVEEIPVGVNQPKFEEVLCYFPENNYLSDYKKYEFIFSYLLAGRKVENNKYTVESVIKECEGLKFYNLIASFYSQLSLNSIPVNGKQITPDFIENYCQKHSVWYNLIISYFVGRAVQIEQDGLRLTGFPDTKELSKIIKTALSFINKQTNIENNKIWNYRCTLYFMSFKYQLKINDEIVTFHTMIEKLNEQLDSFFVMYQKIKFFSYCFKNDISTDGYSANEIKGEINKILDFFPKFSKSYSLANSLLENGGYGDSVIKNAITDHTLEFNFSSKFIKISNVEIDNLNTSTLPKKIFKINNIFESNYPSTIESKQDQLRFPETHRVQDLALSNPIHYEILTMIASFNQNHKTPRIIITGSFSRFLQNVTNHFNDIDLICDNQSTKDEFIFMLRTNLPRKTEYDDLTFSCYYSPEIAVLNVPSTYFFRAAEGVMNNIVVDVNLIVDGSKLQKFNISEIKIENPCLSLHAFSFASEIGAITQGLMFLVENLDSLVEQVLADPALIIPRTILFNYPESNEERVYGLLVRYLLSLEKAIKMNKELDNRIVNHNVHKLHVSKFYLDLQISNLKDALRSNPYLSKLTIYLNDFFESRQNTYQKNQAEFIFDLISNI